LLLSKYGAVLSLSTTYLITFNVRKLERFGNVLGNRTFAAASWASDQADMTMLSVWMLL
jgi:hypothetical protein